MARLRDQLVNFIAALRDAGVRISVAESIDAMNAVAAAGLERARMHEALAAALIKDEADRAIFDELFDRFFAAPRANRGEHPDQRGDQVSAAAGRAGRERIRRRAKMRNGESRSSRARASARAIAMRNRRRRTRSRRGKRRRRIARTRTGEDAERDSD